MHDMTEELKRGDIVMFPVGHEIHKLGHAAMFKSEYQKPDKHGKKVPGISAVDIAPVASTKQKKNTRFIASRLYSKAGLKHAKVFRIENKWVRKMFFQLIRYDLRKKDQELKYMTQGAHGYYRTVKKLLSSYSNKKIAAMTVKSLDKHIVRAGMLHEQGNTVTVDCSSYIFTRLQMALVFSLMPKRDLVSDYIRDWKEELSPEQKLDYVNQLPRQLQGSASIYARPWRLSRNLEKLLVDDVSVEVKANPQQGLVDDVEQDKPDRDGPGFS
jgi:hypothetical protein